MSTRRTFIKQGLFAAASTGLLLSSQARLAQAAALSNKVIVFLFLYGGNDGLNTVVPIDQYDRYQQLRPNLALPKDNLLVLPNAPDLGFNPLMGGLYSLYQQGLVALINGVAPPPESLGLFDHERSQYLMQTGDIFQERQAAPDGWLGRYFGTLTPPQLGPGVDMSGGPFSLVRPDYQPTAISVIDEYQLRLSFDALARERAYARIQEFAQVNPVAEFNRVTRKQAIAEAALVQDATAAYAPAVTYPDTPLGRNLQEVARLLSGDLGVAGISVGLGGFDTHSRQNDPETQGLGEYHDGLLQQVSDAVLAFWQDIEARGQAERVLLMTLSDFGRRAAQNNNTGTDHGFASVSFVLGKTVKGGVYNDYPSLAESDLVFDGCLDIRSDFRSLYATVAAGFLGADPALVAGGDFPLLGFL